MKVITGFVLSLFVATNLLATEVKESKSLMVELKKENPLVLLRRNSEKVRDSVLAKIEKSKLLDTFIDLILEQAVAKSKKSSSFDMTIVGKEGEYEGFVLVFSAYGEFFQNEVYKVLNEEEEVYIFWKEVEKRLRFMGFETEFKSDKKYGNVYFAKISWE